MASLITLEHELGAVKSDLDEKVYQVKRKQIEKKFSQFSKNDLVMEDAIKDAESTFEVVRKDTKAIRSLKRRLNEVKTAMGKEVTKSHGHLKSALYKMQATNSCSPSVQKFNELMLEKKLEGAEMQLEMGLKKLRKIEVFEKDLDTATSDLLSVLNVYQQRCIDRILQSPTPASSGAQDQPAQQLSLPTKKSSQIHVVVEAIRHLRQENEKLKADLESMGSSQGSNNEQSLMVQDLENEICQLKLQLFELQNRALEGEKMIPKGGVPVDDQKSANDNNTADTEKVEDDDFENGVRKPVKQVVAVEESSVDAADEEDSYGFEDTAPSPIPMPKTVHMEMDQICNLELHDMNDIKLVQPHYDHLVLDQMRHEEELEEYAVNILGLKETISELEDENRDLKGQIAFAEGEDAAAEEIQQLESEVSMWRLKYEESAAGSAQVHRLRVELERSKAKSKKRISVLEEDLQTLQKNGSSRIKNLIQKFKAFQEEGAARVQTLQIELDKSRAGVERLRTEEHTEATAETDSDHIFQDESEEDEVDENEGVESSSQSPECAGEDVNDGADESEQVQSEVVGDKVGSQIDEAGQLRAQLEAMKKSMEEAAARAGSEIEQLQGTITSMKAEKEMKQEVISSLHEQLNIAETGLMEKTKSMNFPTMYSYGSFDSDEEVGTSYHVSKFEI